MRHRVLVCYDIANPKRLRRTAQACEGYGLRLQLSVFECLLDDLGYERLRGTLSGIIKHDEDQVLLVTLGPEQERADKRYEHIGRAPPVQSRLTVV